MPQHVAASRAGSYVVHVDRPENPLPLLSARLERGKGDDGEPIVLPALASTDYLLQLAGDRAGLSFADPGIGASIRPAQPLDFLRATERPRVAARLRFSINDALTIRPLLRGTGADGRSLANVMRALIAGLRTWQRQFASDARIARRNRPDVHRREAGPVGGPQRPLRRRSSFALP